PGASLADGKYEWHVRANDGKAVGPWSDDCEFIVDGTPPAHAPAVTSPQYPEDPSAPTGGLETPGTFTFAANGDRDVVGFDYGDTPYQMRSEERRVGKE